MPQIAHPLPLGTIIKVNSDSLDEGIMSWDDTDTEIERVARAGSECHVFEVTQGQNGYMYQVEFIPSEVWNVLDEKDFGDQPENFEIVTLGEGSMSPAYTEYKENESRPRDPEAVLKIEEELGNEGPSL